MYKWILISVILVCASFGYGQPSRSKTTAAAPSTTLPIRRVILYSNGVAYIERRGMVTGDVEVNLSFKQSQIDDVLKSMVVLDLGQGRIGAVSYNSSQPAAARTAEIPFSVEPNTKDGGGLAEVLAQMQGERVVITSSKGSANGSILTIETRKIGGDTDHPASVAYSLVIASEAGEISSYDLADVRSVKLLDENSRSDLNEFANATASTRRRDAKTISVSSNGNGQREMVVSYTVSAPIWKTTYRVVLDNEGKPFFQGWAIVDNVSDEDWRNVQLSLVSGSPVSFIQNLQKPLYRYRPIIPIPEDLNLTPQIYDPEIGQGSGNGDGSGSGSGLAGGRGYATTLDMSPATVEAGAANNNFILSSGFNGSGVSDALMNEQGGVETAAIGNEIGDLFEYKIEQPITVERNRSALIPIVQTKMEGERISVFRANIGVAADDDDDDEVATLRRANPRAMSGLLLKNTTAMTFEGGSMTILDRDAYAGEALMERLKPKEQRLISFALDLGTAIRIKTESDREPAKVVKVVAGSIQVHYFQTEKRIYALSNQTDRPKTIYIEHPIRQNWILSTNFAKPDYTTARFYRFRVELQPFESKEITVGENLGMMDRYTLSTFSPKDLDLFITGRYIDESIRQRLANLIDLRMKVNDINVQLAAFDSETQKIAEDQARFRENIEALSKTPDAKSLIARYIAKADGQESRLEQMTKERKTLNDQKAALERELAIEIKNFEIN